jgi:hypothetical protein
MVRQIVLKSCLVMVALLIPEGGRAIVVLSRLLMAPDGVPVGFRPLGHRSSMRPGQLEAEKAWAR